MDAIKNLAYSTVLTPPSPAVSGTSLVVQAGHGVRFPATSFNAIVCPANADPSPANAEIVRVTAIAGDTLTIIRAQEDSVARTVTAGDRVYAAITKKTFDDRFMRSYRRFTDSEMSAWGTTPQLLISPVPNYMISVTEMTAHQEWVSGSIVAVSMSCRYVGTTQNVIGTATLASGAAKRFLKVTATTFNIDSAVDLRNKGIEMVPTASQLASSVTTSGLHVSLAYYLLPTTTIP